MSEVFCLPGNYRKDVPPSELSVINIIHNLPIVIVANGPLNVFFKLPVTEVSEINDHKSVSSEIENFKQYIPLPLAQLFSVILFFYWLNLCAVSLAEQ